MRPASAIHLLERDYFLDFDQSVPFWPPDKLALLNMKKRDEQADVKGSGVWLTDKWRRDVSDEKSGGYLWRELTRSSKEHGSRQKGEERLREVVLRFPSAPLFGSQSKTGYQIHMKPVHQHTMRLLTASRAGKAPHIKKLFLLFNGLNEIDHFGFYYDLAGLLIANADEDAEVACLIAPFPGHLTRYPLIGKYAEKPLQRFITDPSDLFRQYLRFMVEMQWLMSVLVPVSYYPVTSGIPLLEESIEPNSGRCNDEILSSAIYKSWKAILGSVKRGTEIHEKDVYQSIAIIRKLIGWKPSKTGLAGGKPDTALDPPQLHVIGYSLGGYLAQCVFFTWPFAIGSCTTLCSGGALGSLRPEKIIHQEEWRAITHGLKYELESGILEGRIAADDRDDPSRCAGFRSPTLRHTFRRSTISSYRIPRGPIGTACRSSRRGCSSSLVEMTRLFPLSR
jgi:hypothetical protein